MSTTRKVFTTLNLAIFTTLYLFNFLAVPSSPWKSQIHHLDMHHLVFEINFRFISSASPVLFWFTSSSTCQLIFLIIPLSSSINPSLFHSRLKTYLFNIIILPTLDFFYLLDCLHDNGTGADLSGCNRANSMACHPRATYHIAGCCHLRNSLSCSQGHMPHCRVHFTWRN